MLLWPIVGWQSDRDLESSYWDFINGESPTSEYIFWMWGAEALKYIILNINEVQEKQIKNMIKVTVYYNL